MPKQHRWEIKRELEAAENLMNTAQNHIVKYGAEFEPVHPEIYAQFCAIVSALDKLKDAVKTIRERI
jgi:hypothetical protein